LNPKPEFICFPGDHIDGYTKDYDALRAQWKYWLDTEMSWLDHTAIPIYHTTSNHNTYDEGSETVWREVFPAIPRNGPADQKGLSYYVRRGDLLLVCVNTSFSGLGGYGHVESSWLDQVLTENDDATFKFVAGHHPAHPVNGYIQYPTWRVVPDQAEAFWKVLVRHGVQAYLCSHIIAFDVQVHDGVLQVCTGGAGTDFLMPQRTEFYHCVQLVADDRGLRYQVLDTNGQIREWLEWPISIPTSKQWQDMSGDDGPKKLQALNPKGEHPSAGQWLTTWRFSGVLRDARRNGTRQTLLCGWEIREGMPTVWIGLTGCPHHLMVQLIPESGYGIQAWFGPVVRPDQPFDLQIAVHTGMGPRGILYRDNDTSPWSSCDGTSSKGAEGLTWPSNWTIGCGLSGPSDEPFLGESLRVSAIAKPISVLSLS
jgi:hypothetical protein